MTVTTDYLFSDLDRYRPGDAFPNVGYVRRMAALLERDRKPLVGLMGKKRSGKDSFAATLVEERAFTRFAFADPLKEAVYSLNPIVFHDGFAKRLQDVVNRLGWEAAKENREVRRLLQEYGVGIRAIQEDFWVRATLDRALEHDGPVVITDVRFPNEADEIRARGGVLVRITRPGLESTDTHASETALDDYDPDLIVENSGTLEDLAETARSIEF